MNAKPIITGIISATFAASCLADERVDRTAPGIDDVIWDSPSDDSLGSMPLGNGDVAANVWVEPTGDLVLLLSKTDAYDDFARLLKIGRVRIQTDPPLVLPGVPFKKSLKLRDGHIEIAAGEVIVRVWIDAHHPVVQVDLHSPQPVSAKTSVEIWRTETRMLDRVEGREKESHSSYENFSDLCKVHPDTVLPHDGLGIAWCHHNTESIWERNMRHTGLEEEISKHRDPLLQRTFGAVIRGEGMRAESDLVLASAEPSTDQRIQITVLTDFADSPAEWRKQADALAARIPADHAARFDAHREWWHAFWDRSWIGIGDDSSGTERSDPQVVSQAYALQRYINACAGRGKLPIKFNGSLFTVDEVFDPDYRRWGGPYWLQNTRLPYWSMLYSGDYELMRPLFRMYRDQLPLRVAATKTYFGHGGAQFPETAHFWGNYADGNYGFERGDLPHGTTQNQFIRRHWVGIIEIVGMMLDYYEATGDTAFRDDTLIPMAVETFRFYDQHWQRDQEGRIRYDPAQSLETYWDVVDPTPDVAAMRYLIPRLLTLPVPGAVRAEWERQLADQPEIPMTGEGGETRIAAAREIKSRMRNFENPELYAVFPFHLFTLATASEDGLRTAIRSFHARRHKVNMGWQQGPIWAAMLGLTDEARAMVVERARDKAKGYRFPGFYGPNYDWTPDQDQIGVFQIALQRMLMQCEGDRILLLPAWPEEWDVHFKLHAPRQTTVQARVKDGKVVALKVHPESRRGDVEIRKPFVIAEP
ncbi:DUF5703 domain-containing protein [Haloferula sp. A504]|uniref:DUF5703 domain-containing protein n=1 Tax=Haloferula sp. A504 TaxID=3373601 RepID=UPI0031CA95EB|nr:DUF5703 domain-containing protein [Verrucomicrobiaceae bacterium E54]